MQSVKLLRSISGTRNGQKWPTLGSVVELPDLEAADMIRAGLAVADDQAPAPAPAEVETAAVDAPENAAVPAPGKRKAPARKAPARKVEA